MLIKEASYLFSGEIWRNQGNNGKRKYFLNLSDPDAWVSKLTGLGAVQHWVLALCS